MRETDDIERLFRESFEGFEVTPPASVKIAIDKELESKKRLVWWFSAFTIVLATIVSLLIFANDSTIGKQDGKQQLLTKHTFHTSGKSSPTTTDYQQSSSAGNKKNQLENGENPVLSSDRLSAPDVGSTGKEPATATSFSGLKSSHQKHSFQLKANKTKQKKQSKTKKTNLKNQETNNKITDNQNHPSISNTENDKNENTINTDDVLPDSKMPESINGPVDSISVSDTDSSAVEDIDSVATSITPDLTPRNNDPGNDNKWLVSYYFGPQFDFWKVSKPDFELKLNSSFRTSVELTRKLKSNFGISAGLGYNSFKESGQTTYPNGIDSVFTGMDSIPIYDQQFPDSIIGYNIVPHFSYDSIKGHSTYNNTTTVFYVPVFISKTFELSDQWVIMTDLGATFNFYKTKQSLPDPNSPVKSYNSFGINAALRLYGGYRFSENWMLSAGLTYSVYLKTPVVYQGLNTQRMFVSAQLGIHYSF